MAATLLGPNRALLQVAYDLTRRIIRARRRLARAAGRYAEEGGDYGELRGAWLYYCIVAPTAWRRFEQIEAQLSSPPPGRP